MSEAFKLDTREEFSAPAQQVETRPRDYGLNALRGAAIVIVVLIHAMGNGDDGIQVKVPGNGYDQFDSILQWCALQVFIAVSGYLYAARPVRPGAVRHFVSGKAKRILIPLFAVTALLLLLRALVPGASRATGWEDVPPAFLYRFEHLWYLQSLFLVFVVVALLDRFYLIESVTAWVIAVSAAFLVSNILPPSNIFGFTGLVNLLPYFLIGYGLYRWPKQLFRPGIIPLAWLLVVGGVLLQQLDYLGIIELPDVVARDWGILNSLDGTALCFLVVRYRRDVPGLNFLGEVNYSIFLFHTIGMAVANRVYHLSPWEGNMDVWFWLRVVIGIAFAIAVDLVFRRVKFLRVVFLGYKS